MGRPRLDQRIILRVHSLRGQGMSIDKILDELDGGIARGTVAKYTKQYDNLPADVRRLDQSFSLSLMEEAYEIPWEASPYILSMWAFVQERGHIPDIPKQVLSTLPTGTFRQVRWWWRVHVMAPDISCLDVYWLAQKFSFREQIAALLCEPFLITDLQAFLAYRPWTGDSARQRYNDAIRENRIPGVRQLEAGRDTERQLAAQAKEIAGVVDEPLIGFGGEMGGLLWSQILAILADSGTRKLYGDLADPELFGALSGNHRSTPKFEEGRLE